MRPLAPGGSNLIQQRPWKSEQQRMREERNCERKKKSAKSFPESRALVVPLSGLAPHGMKSPFEKGRKERKEKPQCGWEA